jgi:hypothetical protein
MGKGKRINDGVVLRNQKPVTQAILVMVTEKEITKLLSIVINLSFFIPGKI